MSCGAGARGRGPRQALPRRRGHRAAAGRRCTPSTACRFTLGARRDARASSASPAAASRRSRTASCACSSRPPGRSASNGTDITHLSRRQMRPLRRELHIVFQDPYSSLNPRMTCGASSPSRCACTGWPTAHGARERVGEMFDAVGLRTRAALPLPARALGRPAPARRPRARARSCEPSVLVADEPVSALDVSVQASILNLLATSSTTWASRACSSRTTSRRSSTSATASPSCTPASSSSRRRARELFRRPQHPYTQALLSAAVVPDPGRAARAPCASCSTATSRARSRRPPAAASAPAARSSPVGAARRPRRSRALREFAPGHHVACHLVAPGRPAPRLVEDTADIVSAER